MYLPIDQESILKLPSVYPPSKNGINFLTAFNNFVAVCTDKEIFIWLNNPQIVLCSTGIQHELGRIQKLYWRLDGHFLAATTSKNQMLIYHVSVSDESCFNVANTANGTMRIGAMETFDSRIRPMVHLLPSVVVNLASRPVCCIPTFEDLLVFGENAFAHHISWEGEIDSEMSFKLSSIPFSTDQLQSKPEFVSSRSVHVVDAVYAPLAGGYAIVLSDGRAALLTSADTKFRPNSLLGVWALNLKDAVCCDANHKYRLLIFGCKNGEICAYHIDESNGSLSQIYRVAPKVNNGPDISNRLGPVSSIRVYPHSGGAFGVTWKVKTKETTISPEATPSNSNTSMVNNNTPTNGNPLPPIYAIFSPFGAQTFCNLEGFSDFELESAANEQYTCMEWGLEGLNLWLGKTTGLRVRPVVRNASIDNPIMEHVNRAVFIGNYDIILSAFREREGDASAPHSVWQHQRIFSQYINSNWPIRFATTSEDHLVVAGTRGFSYCQLSTSKWKIFGNESQEKRMYVSGGIFFYENTIGVAIEDDGPKLRFYPMSKKLDNSFASEWNLPNRPMLIANRGDVLAVFDAAAHIDIYSLSAEVGDGFRDAYVNVSVNHLAEIRLEELIPHPACAISLQLTQLNLNARQEVACLAPSVDTVLINVAGRLMTISCSPDKVEDKNILNQPIVVASFVEQMWHDRFHSQAKESPAPNSQANGWEKSQPKKAATVKSSQTGTSQHLSNALWLSCGCKGFKVWMPLIPGKRSTSSQEMSFIAKRIMLPFHLDIYPLVICARNCIAIGVESLPQPIVKTAKKTIFMSSLQRNSEVFVHHLLRQLLKRNLGVFAVEVAASCLSLPHFSHSLELLLHGVLEEEATSSEPIPDPLLPRCVAFIQEFPEFLQAVAHCARKTELALWPHLFAVTGSPLDLFEECLKQEKLDTAASYLIVLQNMETSENSVQQAASLLDRALERGEWTIAREMLRFAHSIDIDDIEDSPPPSAKTSLSRRPTMSTPPGAHNEERNEFVLNRFQAGGKISKVRHSHQDQPSTSGRKDSASSNGAAPKLKHRVSRGQSGDLTLPKNVMEEKMDTIVEKHVWSMLKQYSIRKLGFFITELSVDIMRLLERRRKSMADNFLASFDTEMSPICDFPEAVMKLHEDFEVPYPMDGSHVVHQLEKKLATLNTSVSSLSLNRMTSLEQPKLNGTTSRIEQEKMEKSPIPEEENASGGESEIIQGKLERVEPSAEPVDREGQRSSDGTEAASTRAVSPTSSIADGKLFAESIKHIVKPKTKKETLHAEQLTYMLNVFASARALDLIFLICLLHQDDHRLRQEFSIENVKTCGERVFAHVRFACDQLAKWALENCPGYLTTLQTFTAHLDIIAEQVKIDLKKLKNERVKKAREEVKKSAAKPPTEPTAMTNGRLGDAFEGKKSRLRGRSRSVDRGVQGAKHEHVVSSHDAPQEDGCVIM